jgi:hypothetical protein
MNIEILSARHFGSAMLKSRTYLLAAAAAAVLAACGGSSGSNSTPNSGSNPPAVSTTAEVRTINATSDPATATLSVDGKAINVADTDTQTSEFVQVAPGAISGMVNVTADAATGVSTAASSTPMSMTAAAGEKVSVIAMGEANSTQAVAFKHGKDDDIAADKTGLRVLHAAPRVPAVDIYLSAPDAALPDAPAVPGLKFTQFAPKLGDASLKVTAGDARVRVTLAGAKDVVFDSGTLALPGGKDILVAAIPSYDGGAPIALLILSRDGKPIIVREPRAALRAVHASPDAPAVDVLVNDKVVLKNVSYRDASRFLHTPAGKTNVKVNVAGTATTVIGADLDLMAKTAYTVLAVNKVAAIEPLVIADDGMKADKRKTKVRVVHASPDIPAVDVYVSAPDAALPAAPAIPGLKFKDVVPKSGDAALQLDSGMARIRVTLAGAKDVVFDSGPIPLMPRESLVIAAVQPKAGDPAQKSPVDLLAITRMGMTLLLKDKSATAMQGMSEVRVAHASPDAPNVDVIVDGAKVLGDVPFGAISSYLKVPSGKRDIKVNVAGTQTQAFGAVVDLPKDMGFSVFAINFVSSIEPLLTTDQRHSVKDAPTGFVRAIHASPDAPAVDVLAGGAVALPSVTYKTVSKYLPVPAGKVKFAIALPGTTAAVKEIEVDVKAGESYTVAAIGALDTAKAPANSKPLSLVSVQDSAQ